MRLRQRKPREHDGKHLDYIRSLPCVICGDDTSTEAAHIRMADLTVGKPYTGKAQKPDDAYTVPLCGEDHRDQHNSIEHLWWMKHGIDGVKLALALWRHSGDYGQGVEIIETVRPRTHAA